ncbi:DAK2 domain-containing protein [Salinibacterium sp. M195]|uniref:DAK2 domain-containing protein n=1 Tax=Salinibacterium sp. M195 TaxID=2583374 RepID=UPI001C6366C6|nr:DAK2 domain-containing protein [Salinibacterium sp. M195]QYH35174.1 DAK2 domain-containing protein [Salinibacterium sp. M195]
MNGQELSASITNALADVVKHADELRDLDAALGDGDLGITVSLGAKAVIEALAELPDTANPVEIARTCAAAFADANPSTMAALVAGGLLAGSRLWADKTDVTVADAAAFVTSAAENIGKRGRSQVGDKTILDSLMPAAQALGESPDSGVALDAAIAAAEKGVQDTVSMQSRRGRASWLQERSIGLQDPGATLLWYFLRSWKTSN